MEVSKFVVTGNFYRKVGPLSTFCIQNKESFAIAWNQSQQAVALSYVISEF